MKKKLEKYVCNRWYNRYIKDIPFISPQNCLRKSKRAIKKDFCIFGPLKISTYTTSNVILPPCLVNEDFIYIYKNDENRPNSTYTAIYGERLW